jgi:hypothetical protein
MVIEPQIEGKVAAPAPAFEPRLKGDVAAPAGSSIEVRIPEQ